jgi:hypothetical protein
MWEVFFGEVESRCANGDCVVLCWMCIIFLDLLKVSMRCFLKSNSSYVPSSNSFEVASVHYISSPEFILSKINLRTTIA